MAVSADGSFSLSIEPGAVWTLTTVASAHPGARALLAELRAAGGVELHPGDAPPADAPFPLPYADSFDSYANGAGQKQGRGGACVIIVGAL